MVQAFVATSDMTLSLISAEAHNANTGTILSGTNRKKACDRWILDSNASDHMTYDEKDLYQQSMP